MPLGEGVARRARDLDRAEWPLGAAPRKAPPGVALEKDRRSAGVTAAGRRRARHGHGMLVLGGARAFGFSVGMRK